MLLLAEGRGRHDWEQTAGIIATLINVNRGKDTPPVSPDSINPYAIRDGKNTPLPKVGIEIFEALIPR